MTDCIEHALAYCASMSDFRYVKINQELADEAEQLREFERAGIHRAIAHRILERFE